MKKDNIKSGIALLDDSKINKGTAFSEQERQQFGLESFLPIAIENEDTQIKRVKVQLEKIEKPIDKYIYLMNLQNRNETLFYKILMEHPDVYLPIVYDPTVGEACLNFHLIFQEPRGLYISQHHRGQIKKILTTRPEKDIRFVVITDGSRILGLGDLGANGMGISIGKLALYTAVGSIPPEHLLPICFDMGTNNISYLNDSLYLGLRKNRIEGDLYFSLMDELVDAINEVFPHCCMQFEDFANYKAIFLLEKYKNKICMFNDDIQGTASVTVSAFYTANKITKMQMKDHRILFLGAGSAAHGIADLLCLAMQKEGLSEKEAREKCWLFDTKGLVVVGRERLEDFKKKYAKRTKEQESFLECIRLIKPTAIVGVSTQPHLFTPEIIKEMAKINTYPLILPLSNPTSQEECTAEEAFSFSQGSALFAAGVLFDTVATNKKSYYPTQANNLWIFPAIGMAAFATKAKRINDEMFLIAAKTLSNQVSPEQLANKMLFPDEKNIIEIVTVIASEVAKYIFDNDLARVNRPDHDDHIIELIKTSAYHPFYKKMKGE
jgi:malate dehydrogenase (oxaloacetate-decarboxylating)(NADP+)